MRPFDPKIFFPDLYLSLKSPRDSNPECRTLAQEIVAPFASIILNSPNYSLMFNR